MDWEEIFASAVIGNSEYQPIVEATQSVLVSLGLQEEPADLNIVGTESLVTTQYILREIEHAALNNNITRLALEDVITRRTDRDVLLLAVQSLIWDNNGARRAWEDVTFRDCLIVQNRTVDAHSLSRAMFQLCEYETSLSTLWGLIAERGISKSDSIPITLQVNLQLDPGATLEDLIKVLKLVIQSRVGRVEFGGALSGPSSLIVPHKFAGLFENSSIGTESTTSKKIVFDLFFLPADQRNAQSTNYTKVLLNQCLKQLTDAKIRAEGGTPAGTVSVAEVFKPERKRETSKTKPSDRKGSRRSDYSRDRSSRLSPRRTRPSDQSEHREPSRRSRNHGKDRGSPHKSRNNRRDRMEASERTHRSIRSTSSRSLSSQRTRREEPKFRRTQSHGVPISVETITMDNTELSNSCIDCTDEMKASVEVQEPETAPVAQKQNSVPRNIGRDPEAERAEENLTSISEGSKDVRQHTARTKYVVDDFDLQISQNSAAA